MHRVLSLVLIGLACSCASTSHSAQAGDAPKAKQSEAREKRDSGDEEWKIQQAEVELDIARIEVEMKIARAERKVADARTGLEKAKRDLDAGLAEMKTSSASEQLGLDRSKNNVDESKMELDELIAMYEADEFATTTKELVVQRGRKRLEFAQRGLDIAKQEFEQFTSVQLPEKRRKLEESVADAEFDLKMAERDLEVARMESRLEIGRKERALAKLREGDDEDSQ